MNASIRWLGRAVFPAALACAAGSALAHAGHGLGAGSHWHASDTAGFIAVVAGLAAVAWWRGRK